MRRLWTPVAIVAAVGLLAFAVLVACQSYQFEQVTPKAIGAVKDKHPISGVQKPAKIMLLLDKSGSMQTNPENDNWGCCSTGNGKDMNTTPCGGFDPTGGCKWIAEVSLLVDPGGFLEQTKGNARFGLAIFPDQAPSPGCNPGEVLVEVPQTPGDANIADIKTALNTLAPGGGTPTQAALTTVHGTSSFVTNEEATKRYVVLITDGLPNCNGDLDGDACTCTGVSASCHADPHLCLDDTATVQAVTDLESDGIDTFVIGFGADTQSDPTAMGVLNRMAVAGNQVSGDPVVKYYQAGSSDSLKKILDHIAIVLQACNFSLAQAPESAAAMEVSVTDTLNGNTETVLNACKDAKGIPQVCSACAAGSGDWCYSDSTLTAVTINGHWCSDLQNSKMDQYVLNFMSVKEL